MVQYLSRRIEINDILKYFGMGYNPCNRGFELIKICLKNFKCNLYQVLFIRKEKIKYTIYILLKYYKINSHICYYTSVMLYFLITSSTSLNVCLFLYFEPGQCL